MRIFFILISFVSTLHGQERYSKVNIEKNLRWNKNLSTLDKTYLPIHDISDSCKFYHFRIRTVNQLIELYGDESQTFEGRIFNIIIEQKKGGKKTGRQFFHSKYIFQCSEIEPVLASQLGRFLIAENLMGLPTDSIVENWEIRYQNGPSLRFDIKQGKKIIQLTYRMIWSQPDLNLFVKRIFDLEKSIESSLNLEKLYKEFKQNLDRGKFYTFGDELSGTIHFLTPWESRIWEKEQPRKKWLGENSNMIQEYLKAEIKGKVDKDFDLPESFVFTVNRKGNIVKVKSDVPIFPWERINYPEYNNGIKELKAMLKRISVDFTEIKYPLKFTIYILDGKVSIYSF